MTFKTRKLTTSLRRAIIAAAALSATGTAFAQDAPQAAADATRDAAALDTIVVTAQSREQQLQDVPIALQVVDKALLDDVEAEDLGDIDSFVPGLVVDGVQPTQPTFGLRGISTDDFGIGTDPAVGIYVDGVYGGRGGGVLLPFLDVERIEVLKGPQGTLFGRNTAAGAISLITRRPQDDIELRGRLRVGDYGKRYADAMWNIPTGDNSALRINALINHSDGWFRDGATGKDLGGENSWASRVAWQAHFGDATTLLLSWDHESLDQNGRVTTGIVPLPPFPMRPPAPATPDEYLDPRKLQTFSDTPSAEWRTFDGATMILEHAFDWGSLTSTSSWRQYDSLNHTEEDGTNRADLYVDSQNTEGNRSLYQEFKFAGHNDRLDWVAGASYFDEDAHQTSEVNTNTSAVDNIVRNLGIAPTPDGSLFGFTTMLAQSFGIPVDLTGQAWHEEFRNTLRTRSYAAFGDVIWHATDKLNLTFGLRYTRDSKDFTWYTPTRLAPELDATLDQMQAAGLFDLVPILTNGQLSGDQLRAILTRNQIFPAAVGQLVRKRNRWSDVSPRLVLDYKFTPDVMGYASLAKGYKAGGYNALQIGPAFDNEEVWNLETGIKQSFGPFAYNASLFYYRYDNRQSVRLIDPDPNNPTDIPRFVIDTGNLEAWGADFDALWKVTDAFRVDVAAEWIDSTYRDYTTPEGVNLDGQPTGEPSFSASLGASYRFDLGDGGNLRLSARHAYRGKARCNEGSSLQGNCGISELLNVGEAQQRTDLRVAWTSVNGSWEVAAYGNNVFDHRYVTGLNTYGKDVLGVVGATVSEPRTYGVELTVRY
jgi:iron complex outermembrane receptor protein